jgi:predicted ribosome quality control (RQC) complex YloA/Tae2 family protein
MDSHSFRILGTELLALLEGARVEKIHAPCPGALVCTLFARERKRILVLRFERQAPLLFLAQDRPANPASPPSAVMRLRKFLTEDIPFC